MSKMIKRLTKKLDNKDEEIAMLKSVISNQQGQIDCLSGFEPSAENTDYLAGYTHQQDIEFKRSPLSEG